MARTVDLGVVVELGVLRTIKLRFTCEALPDDCLAIFLKAAMAFNTTARSFIAQG